MEAVFAAVDKKFNDLELATKKAEEKVAEYKTLVEEEQKQRTLLQENYSKILQ